MDDERGANETKHYLRVAGSESVCSQISCCDLQCRYCRRAWCAEKARRLKSLKRKNDIEAQSSLKAIFGRERRALPWQ
jgi:hypothetical protein